MHLLLVRRADRRHGPAMEGIPEGDDFELVTVAFVLVIGPHSLDRAFDCFGTGIGEKHRIGKGQVNQPLGQMFALRAAIEVRHVHQRFGLALDRADQPRMRMAQRIDRDARREIEISAAIFPDQMAVVTAHRPEAATGINWHERSDRHCFWSFAIDRRFRQTTNGGPPGPPLPCF